MSSSNKKIGSNKEVLLVSNTSDAILELQSLKELLFRAQELVENSKEKEHLFEVAGDIINEVPESLERLEYLLDKILFTLNVSLKKETSPKISPADKDKIEKAFKKKHLKDLSKKVAKKYLKK